jgi:hypothetical protein
VVFAIWKFFAIVGDIEAGAAPTIEPVPAGAIADGIKGRAEPYQPAFRWTGYRRAMPIGCGSPRV